MRLDSRKPPAARAGRLRSLNSVPIIREVRQEHQHQHQHTLSTSVLVCGTTITMGASQSSTATNKKGAATRSTHQQQSSSSSSTSDNDDDVPLYPIPTGKEYEAIDKLAAELPNVIDDESKQQVQDYLQACDNGKGPMVACFASGEYLSLFERQHTQAADLYRNVCFRPKQDKSPNGVLVDGTMAYPAGCFNLAKMLMTGKGVKQYDRAEAYRLFDRACRGGHGGACFLQAQLLCSRPGSLGPGVPHDPKKAVDLYQKTCDNGDSISCFTLAAMLLRGDRVSRDTDNVSPQEARGVTPLVVREGEQPRERKPDEPEAIARDPMRAEQLLKQACDKGGHATSCHNLAVMYSQGDDGISPNPELAEQYKKKTEETMHLFGGLL